MTTPSSGTPPASAEVSPASAEISADAAAMAIRSARGALARYRVMAIVTGVMLLLLCVEMVMRYLLNVSDDVIKYVKWIPFAHGWIYLAYFGTVVMLWNKMRWSWGRFATMAAAGVVPVMSFIVERRVHADAQATLDGLAARYKVSQ